MRILHDFLIAIGLHLWLCCGMGAISGIRAGYGLFGRGVPSRTNVTGTQVIGTILTEVPLTSADIIVSMLITFNAAANQVAIDLETMTATATIGSPTIADGDGNDFEGKAISTINQTYAFLIESPDTAAFNLSGNALDVPFSPGDRAVLMLARAPESIALTCPAVTGTCRITIAASAA